MNKKLWFNTLLNASLVGLGVVVFDIAFHGRPERYDNPATRMFFGAVTVFIVACLLWRIFKK